MVVGVVVMVVLLVVAVVLLVVKLGLGGLKSRSMILLPG